MGKKFFKEFIVPVWTGYNPSKDNWSWLGASNTGGNQKVNAANDARDNEERRLGTLMEAQAANSKPLVASSTTLGSTSPTLGTLSNSSQAILPSTNLGTGGGGGSSPSTLQRTGNTAGSGSSVGADSLGGGFSVEQLLNNQRQGY